ncbi:uncharacterized protein [Aegilops tauschii subsp. strangulata]|uniref:uncharacterized protein n=1 Tax=Aegilops tauschii subsp. strangulata TaxID=200361 RepID=UPI001E1CA653|nr:uncharacterized protein LOC109787060 [Aegilops tauschii subsp. strangulata]
MPRLPPWREVQLVDLLIVIAAQSGLSTTRSPARILKGCLLISVSSLLCQRRPRPPPRSYPPLQQSSSNGSMPAICSMKRLCPTDQHLCQIYWRLTKTSTYMMPTFLRSFPDVESLCITPAEFDQAQPQVLRRSGCSQSKCVVVHQGDPICRSDGQF